MPLHYIIDGYNITNHIAFVPNRKRSRTPRETLLDFINNQNPGISRKGKVTIVFDGYPDAPTHVPDARIKVIFSCDESADERIKKIVEASENPREIIVITDDREIKSFVKVLGAGILSVEDFVHPAATASGRVHSQTKEDIEKAGLNYTQIDRINKELKGLWLKDSKK